MNGPLSVHDLLERLEINPETVLVIQNDRLLARDERLEDAATVEVRPVLSGGAGS